MPNAAELARLVRHPEPDAFNISSYVAEHFDALRRWLPGLSKADVVGMRDAELAPLITREVEHRKAVDAEAAAARAQAAASQLEQSARRGSAVLIDKTLLLRELLADTSVAAVQFRLDDGALTFRRVRLRVVARVVFDRPDLRLWVDPRGLHVRWNGGRGGLNLLPDPPPATSTRVLCVDLRAPRRLPDAQPATEAAHPPLRPSRPRPAPPRPSSARRRGSWVDFLTFV